MKIYLSSLAVVVVAIIGLVIFPTAIVAADEVSEAEVSLQQITLAVKADDLGVENIGMVPGDAFYFLKEWRRSLAVAFTFDDTKEAELALNILNEKAAEILKIQETSEENAAGMKKGTVKFFNETKGFGRAVENYEKSQERLMAKIEKLEEASQNPNVDDLLTKLVNRLEKHASIFDVFIEIELEAQAKAKSDGARVSKIDAVTTKQKILSTIAAAGEKDEPEKFASRLEKALDESKGGDLKHFRSIKFVDDLLDTTLRASGLKDTLKTQVKTSLEIDTAIKEEEVHSALQGVRLDLLNKLKDDLEKLTTGASVVGGLVPGGAILSKTKHDTVKNSIGNIRRDSAQYLSILDEVILISDKQVAAILENVGNDLEKTFIEEGDSKMKAQEEIARAEAAIQSFFDMFTEIERRAVDDTSVTSMHVEAGRLDTRIDSLDGKIESSVEKTGPIRLDSTPARLSTNMTAERQTPKRDFGDRMKAGLETAGGILANAKAHLVRAKASFAVGKYKEAFGQARAAEALARSGARTLDGVLRADTGGLEDFGESAIPRGSAMPIMPEVGTERVHPEFEKRVFPETNNNIENDSAYEKKLEDLKLCGPQIGAPGAWVCKDGKWQMAGEATQSSEGRACTQEAKLCSDGSSVGRTGPNCEFSACPVVTVKPSEGVACTQQYDPVCGTNGKTYGNECTAKVAGVEVGYKGECLAPANSSAGY